MSGLLSPAAAKMSMTESEAIAFETIWRTAGSSSPDALRSLVEVFAIAARTAWKNATSSRMRDRLLVRHRQREGLRQLAHRLEKRSLPSSWASTCSCAAGSSDSRCAARARGPGPQSKPWKIPQQTS
jgi:hypothetical protein